MFKKIAIFLFIIALATGYAQDRSAVPVRQGNFGWTKVRAMEAGQCTTTVNLDFAISHSNGAQVLWLDPDTSDAIRLTPDSCATIDVYLKNNKSGEWGKHYSGTVKADTINRAVFNVAAASNDVYIPLGNFSSTVWAWADSARVTLTWGSGDIFAGIGAWVGGQ